MLRATAEQVLSADEYPIPFQLVLTHIAESRDASYMPYAQVALNFHNETDLGDRFEDLPAPQGLALAARGGSVTTHADFELKVELRLEQGRLSIGYVYNTDLFDQATIVRWHRCLERVAARACDATETHVLDFPLLGEAERRQLIEDWNATDTAYPRQRCLHELYAEQAARTPDAVAVACDDLRLSYAELERRANQLAHRLIRLGVGPETAVGLCMARSIELVIGVLGIMKAGGIYVPLDPSYPPERLAFMLEDAQAAVLLTTAAQSERLPTHWAHEIRLDDDWPDIAGEPEQAPAGGALAENLAYVIYTSGSTGKPKGVGVAHYSAINFILACSSLAPQPPGVAHSWWTSMGFDLSIHEIFAPFLEGGRLEIVPDPVRGDLGRFIDWIRTRGIVSTYVPGPGLEMLAQAVAARPGEWAIRRLVVGVEPIPGAVLCSLRNAVDGLRVINGYGPTEDTVYSTFVLRRRAAEPRRSDDRPLPNKQAYVLDGCGISAPEPVGVPGKLCLSGEGLARG